MNTNDRQSLIQRDAERKWERELANEGSYERWLAAQDLSASKGAAVEQDWRTDTAIRRADKVAMLARMRRAIEEC